LERTRERVPLEWAATQNNLGNALLRLGKRESGTGHLQKAVAAYRAALQERTRARVPLKWAETQNNLGTALEELGERDHDPNHLCDALQAHINAWQVTTEAPISFPALTGTRHDVVTLTEHFSSSAYSACLANHAQSLKQMGVSTSPH